MARCCVDVEWVQARIDATKALIEAIEEATLALSSGSVQSYSLNTGQTTQSVTKQSIGSYRLMLPQLEDRLQYYQNKLCGGATVYVRPAY